MASSLLRASLLFRSKLHLPPLSADGVARAVGCREYGVYSSQSSTDWQMWSVGRNEGRMGLRDGRRRQSNNPGGGQQGNSWVDAEATPVGEHLAKYCVDLTERAREGKLDPVIGRDAEIRRTLQVLARRTKNNPVLIGEPGTVRFS